MHIRDYEMEKVILDLGSDVNILPKKHGKEWGDLCCSGL